jgi:methionyl-tRNA formyltransferase
MGTPEYADRILKRVLEESWIEVVALFTQPDKPVGRKKVLTPPPTKDSAIKYNIPVFQPERLRDSADEVKKLNPDFIVVGAYGQILNREILDVAPAINLHTSVLPKYRGASPIQQAILNSDSTTGVTAMLMNEGLDTGDILAISNILIDDSWKIDKLYNTLTDMAGELVIDVLKEFQDIKPLKQSGADASHCGKISKSDGEVEFLNSDSIYQKFKAFSSWPSIYLKNGLKLLDISKSQEGSFRAGEILEIYKDRITVGCKDGAIDIFEVQPKSKSRMDIQSYINGKRLKVGDIFQ